MPRFLLPAIIIPALLFWVKVPAYAAVQAPAPPGFSVSLDPQNKALCLSLNFKDAEVTSLLQMIALGGNLDMIVRGNVLGTIDEVNLSHISPERAAEEVVKLAQLECKLDGNTYIISSKTPTMPDKKPVSNFVELNFSAVSAAALLQILSMESKIPVTVEGDIKDTIPFIRIRHLTWAQAIEKAADAAKLTWRKEGLGYVMAKAAP